MSAPRFFVAQSLAGMNAGDTLALPEQVAHHATRVLRLAPGTALTLFDGTGGEYVATLIAAGKRGAEARIERFDPVERESPLALTLVQAVLATDAMDYAVRKAVELGVARIAPVVAERSQRLVGGDKAGRRVMHWRAIAIAACEQCGRNRIPAVDAPRALDDWLSDAANQGGMAMAGPGAGESLASLARRMPPRHVLIGPEGGFTLSELARAAGQGATIVHLGPRILRAETAAVAALAMLAAVAGDAS